MLTELAYTALIAGASAGAYAYAANWPTSQIFGKTVVAGSDPRQIALTFDDGPNDPHTPRLLEVLAHCDVRATFFLIGEFVKLRPDIVRSIRAAGHLVGNHTMTHPVLLWQRSSHVREELEQCNVAIEDALGEAVEYFRPPHGARRPDVIRIARELGLTTVMWNTMGYDWTAPPAAKIVERVEGGLKANLRRRRGSNVLLHDGSQHGMGADRSQTVAAVKALLSQYRSGSETTGVAAGDFVRVDEWALPR